MAGLAAQEEACHVTSVDAHKGFVARKVWLTNYELPLIKISNVLYNNVSAPIPTGIKPDDAAHYTIVLGEERKRPFAWITVPVYTSASTPGTGRLLTDFTITITEKNTLPGSPTRLERTAAASSVLKTGNWYKIGITNTGFYKVDFDFLAKAGISTTGITLSNIRVFGNGGNMLSEDNAVPRINDLAQNAIWVNDNNNNGTFDKGDYLVFYGTGPTGWIGDAGTQLFTHQTNIYSDTAYYFLNFDGPGNRITTQAVVPAANETITDYNAYMLHEQELINLGPYGREWWGESFTGTTTAPFTQLFTFNTGPATGPVNVYSAVGSRGPDGGTFTFVLNGSALGDNILGSAGQGQDDISVSEGVNTWQAALTGSTATFSLTYTPAISGSNFGYLNFIELNYRRSLVFTDAQLSFRDWHSVGAGKVANYQIQNANGFTQAWDITDPINPVRMNGNLSGSVYNFSREAYKLHEFAAFNSDAVFTPTYIGNVPNQDIHGSPQVDLLIVTYPSFIDAANELSAFHQSHDNMRVLVATTTQVYNEFSSGAQDISAIRDMARMFYDRAGTDTTQMPKSILLFGNGSYDYKNRVANNSNYVPTFESPESHYPVNSFASDDFFGMLDSNENIENGNIYNTLDIGVGRLPIYNTSDAASVINKIQVYKSPQSLGPWRISGTYVGDKEDDAGAHMSDADNASTYSGPLYNNNKVFVDAINTISTPGGSRSPNANQAIDNQIYKGTFIINYTGHGNTQVWSNYRILTSDDYNSWNNVTKLPFIITATCDFGQFDNPSYVSAGEQLVIRNNGGAIATITTTQQTYESENKELDTNYLRAQFARHSDDTWNSFGEAFRIGKNATYIHKNGNLANFRKFALLGDPALEPDFPQYKVLTDSILDGSTHRPIDSIGALGSYLFSGSIVDAANNVLPAFTGTLYVTIYDKPRTVNLNTYWGAKSFNVQDNIIYKGKVSVTNGHFTYSFIAPKDINYSFGDGKISYYADNGVTDAAGGNTGLTIGGYSDNPVISAEPPVVKPFMNDTLFRNGGITGSKSLLYVQLYDRTGINVSGNAVGHDLTAVLDGDVQNPYILNDFYETLPNTYQYGFVSFPMAGLSSGKHTITVKAWDVNNNSGEGSVNFVVADSNVMAVQNVLTYPNPFRDIIHFVFDHNHPEEQLQVEISIYNTTGALVRTLKQSFMASGSRTDQVTWDGTTTSGAKLPSGVYLCRMKIANAKNVADIVYQKVVLIR